MDAKWKYLCQKKQEKSKKTVSNLAWIVKWAKIFIDWKMLILSHNFSQIRTFPLWKYVTRKGRTSLSKTLEQKTCWNKLRYKGPTRINKFIQLSFLYFSQERKLIWWVGLVFFNDCDCLIVLCYIKCYSNNINLCYSKKYFPLDKFDSVLYFY